MNGVIAWFAENKVAANLLMLLIVVAGYLSLMDTRKEILPDVSLDLITITIPYPGASPDDVEKSVLSRVESVIYDIEGIRTISSQANEHLGVVTVELGYGYDSKDLLNEIKSRVEAIGSFPVDAGRPIIKEISVRNMVAYVVISGPADESSLKRLAEQVKSELTALPNISQVENAGVRPFEIAIEVSESSLQRYGLSFAEVAAAVRQSSLDLPAGVIKTAQGSVSVKAKGQVYWGDDFEEIVLRALPDGAQVLVRDVAKVTDGFKEGVSFTEFNGKPAVALSVYRVGDQNILEISEALKEYVKYPGSFIPENIELNVWLDNSVYFKGRMDLLTENAVGGLILVFAILLLFLSLGLSFWVSLGIPISFMGAFMVLPHLGGSLNMISLFAFILVLGIVVDDAIIVGENIFTKQKEGLVGLKASIAGAQEVAMPVVFAVLTTVIAFLPMVFMPGPEGKLMSVIPIVVIATLLFSLLESLLVLPSHLSGSKPEKPKDIPGLSVVQRKFSDALELFISGVYRPFLEHVLRWRYTALFGFVAVLVVALGFLATGWLKIVFFSTIESDTITAQISFSQNAHPGIVRSGIKTLESRITELRKELREKNGGEDQILNVFTNYIGDSSGVVLIELATAENRKISGMVIEEEWRKRTGDLPEMIDLKITSTLGSSGTVVDIEFSSNSLEDLHDAAEGLKARLAEYQGVYNIKDSFQKGKQELVIELKPVARNLGLSLDEVAGQVRQAYHGVEVQSIQRGDSDVNVVVRYPFEERSSLWYLENMHIRLRDGSSVPLLTVADIDYGEGASQIKRNNRRRVIRVDARIDESITNEAKVMEALRSEFLNRVSEDFPGMTWSIAGVQKDRVEFMGFLKQAYLIALLSMYVMMATLFRSYSQPLMVMFAIPFGLIGALLGHFMLDRDVTLWSIVGMVAVSGVVVNDNLVLVDYINRNREKGIDLLESIREAGVARFRPIMLTSLTTFGGLTPLMMERSFQAQFLIPMAISLAFGVMFATLISLILVPAAYYILHDMEHVFAKLLKSNSAQTEKTEAYAVAQEVDKSFSASDDDSEKLQWHVGLDEAYEMGYANGLEGKRERKAPFDLEVLIASWEAGWDDGHEDFILANKADPTVS